MRGVPPFLNFNGGEVSDLFDSRTDQDRYNSSCSILENFLCTLQGPIERRGGTVFVAPTKNNEFAWLGRFIFNRTQSYILEFGDAYLRFFTNRGQLFNMGSPFEIATPWVLADITNTDGTFSLQFAQDGDFLYIFHSGGTIRPKVLSRLGAVNWTITDFPFDGGPFQDVDPDNTITVDPSGLTGNITLVASSSIFSANHIGSLMYFEINDDVTYTAWETNKAKVINDKVTYQGNYYQATNGATTGTLPPTHIRGTRSDGAVNWQYLHSGYGVVQITAVASGTNASATVLKRLPGNGANVELSPALNRWAFQDVGNHVGWPTCVDFFKERLSCARNNTVYFSSTGAPTDFNARTGPLITAIDAIRLPVRQREIEKIRWLSGSRDLICGTPGFEFTIGPQTRDQVFSALNVTSDIHTKYGSTSLQPVVADNSIIMVQAGGTRLREVLYSYEIDRYKADDISILAEHVSNKSVRDVCLQNEKQPIIWAETFSQFNRRNNKIFFDSALFGVTFNKARQVIGYHRHVLGGFNDDAKTIPAKVLSCETISSPNGDRDDLWLLVERRIGGATKRYIEYMEDHKLVEQDLTKAFYVDSGLTYEGALTSIISGLDHLEGQVVQINAGGGAHPDRVVVGGSITLAFEVTIAHVGLGFRSLLQTMRPDFGAQDGTSQSRVKSTTEICVRILNTIGMNVGTLSEQNPVPFRPVTLPVGVPTPLFSGDVYCHMPAEWDRDGYIVVTQEQPLPMTIQAIYPRLYTND